ncbi:hypothetical protein AB0H77_27090 [Streptomyces sp. NPDC050844]
MSAPIVVHPPAGSGGRRVTVRGEILGLAYADAFTDLSCRDRVLRSEGV